MPSSHPLPPSCHWFSRLASALDPRSAPRLAWLLVGAVLARGRRTVTSWIRAAGLSGEYRPCYTTVVGRREADRPHRRPPGPRGRQAAGGRRRPADVRPGRHPDRAVRAARARGRGPPQPDPRAGRRPVRVRARVGRPRAARRATRRGASSPSRCWPGCTSGEKNLAGIAPKHRPAFRTKLELAVELMRWASAWLGFLGKPLWVVADGAYAKAPFLKPMRALGGDGRQPAPEGRGPVDRARGRGRSTAAARTGSTGSSGSTWRSGPGSGAGGRPGRSPCTGSRRRSGTRRSWRRGGRPAGAIRVVLVDEPKGWVAFFCTDPAATVADILGCVADRFCAGDRVPGREGSRRGGPAAGAVRAGERRGVPRVPVDVHDDRGVGLGPGRGGAGRATGPRRPWDDEPRRPSHADKRRAWRRELLGDEIRAVLRPGLTEREIQAAAERLLNLAA